MAKKFTKLTRVEGRLTDEQRARHAKIRQAARQEFPPQRVGQRPAAPGLGAVIRAAREAQGLSWYALSKRAGLSNQNTVRDIELGRDAKVSNLRAIVQALGLEIELVPIAEPV